MLSRSFHGEIPFGVRPRDRKRRAEAVPPKRDCNNNTAINIHTMSTIMEELVERPQSASGKAETRPADSRTSTASESKTATGPAWRGFGNTPTQTSNHDRPSKSFDWTAFSGRFDGLRIPSSPLHDF